MERPAPPPPPPPPPQPPQPPQAAGAESGGAETQAATAGGERERKGKVTGDHVIATETNAAGVDSGAGSAGRVPCSIAEFCSMNGLGGYVELMVDNEIDLDVLPHLDEEVCVCVHVARAEGLRPIGRRREGREVLCVDFGRDEERQAGRQVGRGGREGGREGRKGREGRTEGGRETSCACGCGGDEVLPRARNTKHARGDSDPLNTYRIGRRWGYFQMTCSGCSMPSDLSQVRFRFGDVVV